MNNEMKIPFSFALLGALEIDMVRRKKRKKFRLGVQ